MMQIYSEKASQYQNGPDRNAATDELAAHRESFPVQSAGWASTPSMSNAA